ncbi:MAG: hypothetical protein A3H51_00320 [Candidatus Spechtbacteria bacterium RIFCSPLOWO2_02_FULL_38_8]|uniref:Glycosyltransferase 2-like domain-containing protein n=1 Tax=Candidatus Spechtbacteria bacterium RIFCSPLOWO2_02_FULL_38_8 TaxID=1802164 RepID=A0A1G2HH53_9BACT|nr:MAG: hypothetical protein A3H51_00320 [Candidatus Spechtbacteria bacterium RIFCSPLOWO2_02_FULL_38_8]
MHTSIIVNHYRSPEVLKTCLGYLSDWQKQFNKESEIIVTDSEFTNETQEMVNDKYPAVTYIGEQKNVGFGVMVNKGIDKSRGKFLFIVNADVFVTEPEELNKLIDYLEKNEEVGIAGPKLLNFDETFQPSAFRYYTPITIILRRSFWGKTKWGEGKLNEFELQDTKNLLNKTNYVDWLMGSAFIVRREVIDKIGKFDERFFMYMEDVDFCRRIWQTKYKVAYYPLSKMYHFHGAASRSRNIFKALFNKYTRIHLASAYKYFRKHGVKKVRHGI